jgi:hypothetical protein
MTASALPTSTSVGVSRRLAPGRDHDHVLPARIDENQRDAAFALITHHTAGVDPLALERSEHEFVPAYPADEPHPGAEPRGRYRLIRALAARDPLEHRVGHRLTGTRQPLAARDQVDVR